MNWLPHGLPNFNISQFLYNEKNDADHSTNDTKVVSLQFNNNSENIALSCLRPAGSVSIECIDEGPGLSADQVEKLFGQGVQFNASELQSGGGSGLGLWISKVVEK